MFWAANGKALIFFVARTSVMLRKIVFSLNAIVFSHIDSLSNGIIGFPMCSQLMIYIWARKEGFFPFLWWFFATFHKAILFSPYKSNWTWRLVNDNELGVLQCTRCNECKILLKLDSHRGNGNLTRHPCYHGQRRDKTRNFLANNFFLTIQLNQKTIFGEIMKIFFGELNLIVHCTKCLN